MLISFTPLLNMPTVTWLSRQRCFLPNVRNCLGEGKVHVALGNACDRLGHFSSSDHPIQTIYWGRWIKGLPLNQSQSCAFAPGEECLVKRQYAIQGCRGLSIGLGQTRPSGGGR